MRAASTSFPAGVRLGTKLNAPTGARRRVARDALVERLIDPEPRRLTLIDAPAGWGKTTLLAEWAAEPREERRFAWFTVDRGDNDPVRFWDYAIESLRSIAPSVGASSLPALGVSGTDPVEVVLPPLINELAALEERLVLVLEDYQLIQTDAVHAGVSFLLDHLPTTLELAIATRLDPPLPLARLRARGEMLELRTAELRFDEAEAEALLESALGDALTATDVERLVVRTEGWPAGLYLAALSLGGRDDASGFIEAFAGDDRHVVDYLGGEVLDGTDPATREFLLRTSILERLCGPLCDHVLGGAGAAGRLLEIERANLFLVALDARREWYRYHHLFGDLLRYELERSEPELIPELHLRAAAWLGTHDFVDEAIRHLLVAGEDQPASRLVAASWRAPFNRGELATVDRWLDDLPEPVVLGDRDLCLARAWVLLDSGRVHEVERWLPGAESGPSGEGAVLRAVLGFKLGRIAEAERKAREALAVASPESPLGLAVASCILGIARFYGGELEPAAEALEDAARLAAVGDNTLARIYALGYLGLIRIEQGDVDAARATVAQALELCSEPAAAAHFVTATALLAHGRLDSDEAALEQAVTLARRGAAPIEVATALLGLGELRRDPATLAEARATLAGCDDPGRLPDLIEAAEIGLRGRRPGPRRRIAGDLSDRELAVLRLLPSGSSLREIAGSLYLSLNTVKTHSRSIYRKLNVSTRAEAVERARELGLL